MIKRVKFFSFALQRSVKIISFYIYISFNNYMTPYNDIFLSLHSLKHRVWQQIFVDTHTSVILYCIFCSESDQIPGIKVWFRWSEYNVWPSIFVAYATSDRTESQFDELIALGNIIIECWFDYSFHKFFS